MYINPFVAGIFATLIAEGAGLIITAIFFAFRDDQSNKKG